MTIDKLANPIFYKEQQYLLAKERYYEGSPIMSDEEFDNLEKYLKSKNSNIIKKVGTPVKGVRDKYNHITPMLSLNKFNFIHANEDEFSQISNLFKNNFLNQNGIEEELNKNGNLLIEFSPKFDGNAINIIYEDGKLFKILSRGDGTQGNDITEKLKPIVPFELSKFTNIKNKYVEIRAEVVINLQIFEKKYASEFKNARNFVAGLLNSTNSNETNLTYLLDLEVMPVEGRYFDMKNKQFVWSQDIIPPNSFEIVLTKSNFETKLSNNSFKNLYQQFVKMREENNFKIDGIVCKIKNDKIRNIVSSNEHHPRWAIAIKFPAVKIVTTIQNITWNMSKVGELIPLIHVDPIDIDGSIVTKCSGHNWGYIFNNKKNSNKKLGKGTSVVLEKAGDIIPSIVEVLEIKEDNIIELLECPFCKTKITIKDDLHAICENEYCNEKLFQFFSKNLEKLEINFLGEATRRFLFECGYKTPIDVLLDKNICLTTNNKSVNIQKINDYIQNITEIPLFKIIQIMGIKDCGERASKILEKIYLNREVDLKGMQKNILKEFENTYKKILAEIIIKLHNKGIELITGEEMEKTKEDFTYEMTGSPSPTFKTKKDVEIYLNDFGGKPCSKFDKEVKYLFTDDITSTTSKMVKASKLGVEIIEYTKILEKFKK